MNLCVFQVTTCNYVPSAQEAECHRQIHHPPCHRMVCRWYVGVVCMCDNVGYQIYTRSIMQQGTDLQEILTQFEEMIGLQIILVCYVRCRCRTSMYVQCYQIRAHTDILV